jgi:hypothetical protein
MRKINPNKATDIYSITPAIIRDLSDFLPPILSPLFNKSIEEAQYPDALKYTKLIELYKSGDTALPTNFRPISLLPIIAKLLDTMINDQLMEHLLKTKQISPTQYAFRPGSDTTLALLKVLNDIHSSTDNSPKRKPTIGFYIDLSKAYDTISHDKLIEKLEKEFNFTPDTVKFFRSYLQNRQQETHTQHAKSTPQTITHGIPQGSTLSTTLFLLYINNITKTVPNSTVYTYADDTTLLITADSIEDLQKHAQNELDNLIKYFHLNNLVPNPTKTVYTLFHPATTQQEDLTFKMSNNAALQHTDSAKLLGIYIQRDLKQHSTINNIVKKLQPVIQMLRYATTLLPTQYMIRLYYTFVYPHLIGAISVWGTSDSTAQYMQPLRTTHKKIVRIVCNQPPRTHTMPLMNKHGILGLEKLYILRVSTEIHPYIHPNAAKPSIDRPQNDHQYVIITDVHAHGTRYSKNNMFIPNTNKYSKTQEPTHTSTHYAQIHTSIWNKLPTDINSIKCLTTFKTQLKLHLLETQRTAYQALLTQGYHQI